MNFSSGISRCPRLLEGRPRGLGDLATTRVGLSLAFPGTIIVVSSAGRTPANGHYFRDGTKRGGWEVWTKEGDANYKIQWSTRLAFIG